MEVEHSASSKCLGAFERRRETSTREERWEKIEEKMADESRKTDDLSRDVNRMLRMMETMMNQAIVKFQEDIKVAMEETIEGNMKTIEERLRAEKAAVIIQAFLRTTAVRVKLDRAKYLWGTQRAHIYWVFNTFRLGPWWKDYRERQEAKARARAAAKARKRAKAKQRKQVKLDGNLDGSTGAEAISGGDAITVDERMQSGDEDDSSVPVKGRDAATSIQGVELSLGGAIDGLAIYGADVYAGHKCESYASDGTFYEANVGGDNDEKYEDDDFSVSEVLPAPCDSDRIVGMCFQNVNVERVFLYYHYEFVKRDFG